MNVNIFFTPSPIKRGTKKEDGKPFLFEDYHGWLCCESISSSLYTSQSSPPSYLWDPSARIPWLSFWWLSNLFSPHIPFPIRTTMDHNPQQQPTPTRRDKFVVILLVPLLLPPSPTLHFSMLAIFIWYNFWVQLLDHHHNSDKYSICDWKLLWLDGFFWLKSSTVGLKLPNHQLH